MQRVRNLRNPSVAAKAVAAGLPPPSCAVVGESELQTYHEKCTTPPKTEADRRAELRRLSQERVQHWPNTIEAQRLKKERVRKERMKDEEIRRCAIDDEVNALAVARKENAVRKANVQLYEENDRIKTFTSKLFLATVLDEREKQLGIKEEKAKLQKEQDLQWAIIEAETLRKAEAEEAEKAKKLRDRVFQMKDTQLQQLADIRTQKIAERDARRKEGAEIRVRAIEAVEEERRAEEQRLLDQKRIAHELVEANEAQKRIREAQLQKEREEAEKVAEYARVKEAQMLERKRRVDEKFSAKLLRRQKLIDHQAQHLAELQAQTEEREMKALRDFEKDRADREAREAAIRERRQNEIDRFRKEQLLRKELLQKRAEAERQRIQDVWRDRAEHLIEEELDERRETREGAETLQHFQLLQMNEKEQQKLHEKRLGIEEGLSVQAALKEEQDMYHAYVNTVMSEYVRHGRDASIVKRAAKSKGLKSSSGYVD